MNRSPSPPAANSGTRPVTVSANSAPALAQPDEFHLCPLGLQFYTEKAIDPFTVLEVDIEAPYGQGQLRTTKCAGAVVRCQPDKASGRFRVWLQFLDLTEGTRECLRCTAREGQLLCSYCQNF